MMFVTCGFISIIASLWMMGELGLVCQKASLKACHTPTHSHHAIHCLQHPHLTLQLLLTSLTLVNLVLSLMHCLPCSSELYPQLLNFHLMISQLELQSAELLCLQLP